MSMGDWIFLVTVVIYGVFGFTAVGFNIAFWLTKAKFDYENKLFMLLAIIPISLATPILIIGAVCGFVL